MPTAGRDHPIETPVRHPPLKIGTTTATYVYAWLEHFGTPASAFGWSTTPERQVVRATARWATSCSWGPRRLFAATGDTLTILDE